MNFILAMAWRDSRRSRSRLLLFSFSVVLGIAALVAINSVTANSRAAVEDQSKTLLGADLAITSRAPLPAALQDRLKAAGGQVSEEISFSSMAVFPTCRGQTRLVSVRAVRGAYPFYGDVVTDPAGARNRWRDPRTGTVIADETLLEQFGVKPGDPIKLGRTTFTVAGALKKMPGDSAAVAILSPRVYMPLDRLAETGLTAPGSLLRYRTYARLPNGFDADALVTELRQKFGSDRLSFETVEDRKRELGQSLKNVYAFFSLVGFISLFLGGIGVASAMNTYVRQKLSTVAVLRCLGASARQSFAIYLVQGVAIGVLGAVVGAGLGIVVQVVLTRVVHDFLPFEIAFFISWPAIARGVFSGLTIAIVFTLLPLLSVRRVSPLLALRAAFSAAGAKPDWLRRGLLVVIGLAVVAFAVAQTDRWIVGLGFAGGLLVTLLALAGVARGLSVLARKFAAPRLPYVWRQGIANLHRPNNRTVLLLVSLGLGAFLLLTLALTRESLLAQIRGRGAGDRPDLLFFDIQDDQIAPLETSLRQQGFPVRADAPIVTMRISSWKGRPVRDVLEDPKLHLPAWTLRREYRSTFRDRLGETEKLLNGKFVPRIQPDTTPIPISIEEGLAKDMQLDLGDELGWDVQGVTLLTKITSIRTVDWQRLQPNFFIVFPDGVLEGAPKSYVVATRAGSAEKSAALQQSIVKQFPNVSAIDLSTILQTLDNIFAKVEYAVRFIALFTAATGGIVLIGAILTGRFQRVRESVLLRTLGATGKQLVQIQLVEYAVLGLLAALTGGGLAFAANALLARFVFHLNAVAPPAMLGWTVLILVGLTLLTGFFANRSVTKQPPLEILREEI
jgi:putative ABC transport system permease protein